MIFWYLVCFCLLDTATTATTTTTSTLTMMIKYVKGIPSDMNRVERSWSKADSNERTKKKTSIFLKYHYIFRAFVGATSEQEREHVSWDRYLLFFIAAWLSEYSHWLSCHIILVSLIFSAIDYFAPYARVCTHSLWIKFLFVSRFIFLFYCRCSTTEKKKRRKKNRCEYFTWNMTVAILSLNYSVVYLRTVFILFIPFVLLLAPSALELNKPSGKMKNQ